MKSPFERRKALYRKIEHQRETNVIAYVTGDRRGLETRVAPDVIDLFVHLLDAIGPTKRISLILHTNGGDTAAAWRLINLVNTFCDELEVIVPLKALSAGTLMSLGAQKIVMTKQAALGPIDPSLNHALNPQVVGGNPESRVPVSVEAVRGYLDEARQKLGIDSPELLVNLFIDLSNKIHPLVLGQIFRSRQQIRFLAEKLLSKQIKEKKKRDGIIDFLCADSGSHDYTINRREAADMGFMVEKPSEKFYQQIRDIWSAIVEELELLNAYSPQIVLGGSPSADYELHRGLVEGTLGGSYAFVTEGKLVRGQIPGPVGPQETITDQRTFEGWRKIS